MEKTIFDICPVTNKETYLNVTYTSYGALDVPEGHYAKFKYSCSNRTCKNIRECPLFKKVPSYL